MTRYFYDTEFLEDGRTIEFISIGIVCEDGREFYAVNRDADWDRIRQDRWLMTNVVPQLPSGIEWESKRRIAEQVRLFLLSGATAPELWAWYSAYDHVVLAQLFGKMIHLPDGIPMFTNDLRSLVNWARPPGQMPEQVGTEHDALDDARWVRDAYDWVMSVRPLTVPGTPGHLGTIQIIEALRELGTITGVQQDAIVKALTSRS